MQYAFPYHFTDTIEIPDKNLLGIFQVKNGGNLDEAEIIQKALSNPIGAPRLKELVKSEDHILILPDDVTRKTPADRILPFMIKELEEIGVPDTNIRFLMSLGTHRKMTLDELATKLGREIVNRFDHSLMVNKLVPEKRSLKSRSYYWCGLHFSTCCSWILRRWKNCYTRNHR